MIRRFAMILREIERERDRQTDRQRQRQWFKTSSHPLTSLTNLDILKRQKRNVVHYSMLKFIGVMWSQTNWMLWNTGWPQLVPRHNDQQNLRHSKKLMLHHLFPGKKTGPGGFVQADVLYMCLVSQLFQVYFPKHPRTPIPSLTRCFLLAGRWWGAPRAVWAPHRTPRVTWMWIDWVLLGEVLCIYWGKTPGRLMTCRCRFRYLFCLGFLWAMRINTLLMI